MDLVQRAKNICLSPASEWAVIETEPATTGALLTGYALPLAAIGAIAGFIGRSLIGTSVLGVYYRTPFVSGVIGGVFAVGISLVMCFALALIVDALAPTFGGQKSQLQALKLVVFAYTPAWLAGVLQIVPLLGILGIFAGLYAIYVMYLGIPKLMKAPQDKSVVYTLVVVVCAIVLFVILGLVSAAFVGAGMLGSGALSSMQSGSSPAAQIDQNSPLGKLQAMAKAAEDSSKKVEAAGKAGDPNTQAAAAMAGLGAILGGGKHVDPLELDQLKAFVPETLGGLRRTSSSAEKNGLGGLQVAKAEAQYSDGAGKSVRLEISDSGGVSGLMALAGWAGVEGEHEDENGTERTHKVDGRLVHEKSSKSGNSEYGIVLGDRFVVSARGDGVDLNALKAAVASLDLGKLESLKNTGVKQ